MPKIPLQEFQDILKRLEQNDPNLTRLDLRDKQIDDAGARELSRALEKNQTLTTLDLGWNKIGEAGARELSHALEKNQTLTTLDLVCNQIGDAGAQELSRALEKNQTLTTLELLGNQIGDAGARELSRALEKNQTLTTLDLVWNQIGDAAVRELSRALEKNQTLTTLDLKWNKIGEAGARELSHALEKNQTLTALHLGSNQIGDEFDRKIEVKIEQNKRLRADCYKAIQEGNLEKVQFCVSQGVSLLSVDDMGVRNTPLHVAVINNKPMITQYLMQEMQSRDIPLNIRNEEGKTAADLAKGSPLETLFTSAENKDSFTTNTGEKITYKKELGRGAFGVVYKGSSNGSTVAIKKLLIQTLTADQLTSFKNEVSIMLSLDSPYIVKIKGFCLEKNNHALVMEYVSKGSLQDLLRDTNFSMSWDIKCKLAVNIGKGLIYLHSQRVIYRDLKSANVLITESIETKLADFGISKRNEEAGANTTIVTDSFEGTQAWTAPELFDERPRRYNQQTDMYSYAVVLWELASREKPFSNRAKWGNAGFTAVTNAIKGVRETIPSDTPRFFKQVIEACWEKSRDKRPTAEEATQALEEKRESESNCHVM